ncbi:MAG: TDP-N-acetylfucosamine:lipid II N-acetylfucosaminyltransferase [Saprospiraceae bacterium]|nr:TDP-N-acetylfucosamine:lipid II N-acetylfucosaminyltransferase [Saprospiraceae bacterium]
MSKAIVHICKDEKFIQIAKHQFNKVYNQRNLYYIIVKDTSQSPKHVTVDQQTILIDYNDLHHISKKYSDNTVFIFHSITNNLITFIDAISKENRLIWMFFGMEIYNDESFYPRKQLLAPITFGLFPSKKPGFTYQLKNAFRPYVRIIKLNLPLSIKEKKIKAFNRFDNIGILHREDYLNIIKLGRIKKSTHFEFTYYPLELIVDVNEGIITDKRNILIGNSGHISNNHIDVFSKLSNFRLKNKIVIPLSYGDTNYIKKVKENAAFQISSQVEFLENFLSLEEYNQILKKVSVFILYARRQQGVGNIIALLWHGAKVFLSKENTFYHYLKRLGVIVFRYEDELSELSINQELSLDEIRNNREILFTHLNEERLISKLKEQMDSIL